MLGFHSVINLQAYGRIMSYSDALKLKRSRDKEIEIFVRPLGRNIVLRSGSTDRYCFEKIFLYDEYRSPFDITEPRLIIDGGANIGMASLYFVTKYPNATIFAIEPEIENFKMLLRNCAGIPNIIPKNAALWPTKEKLSLTNLSDSASEAWAYAIVKQAGEVETITIEQIISESGLSRVDFLKLDIEGAEKELFDSSPEWLNKVDQIGIELHDRYKPGCSRAFYSAILKRYFHQELRGENIFISFKDD